MDRPRSRQRANSVGADQPEHKPARTTQALEQTKEPSKLAFVNSFALENQRGHGLNSITSPNVFAPHLALKFTRFNQNVLRQSQDSRTPRPRGRSGVRSIATASRSAAVLCRFDLRVMYRNRSSAPLSPRLTIHTSL